MVMQNRQEDVPYIFHNLLVSFVILKKLEIDLTRKFGPGQTNSLDAGTC